MKYSKLTLGQIEAIINKLGGEEGALRFLRGEIEVVVKTVVAVALSVWKTLTVGTFRSVKEVETAFSKAGMCLGDCPGNILGKLGQSTQEFVRLRVCDLGFTERTKLRDILAAGQKKGLDPCLPEDGPAIRLSYPDQPMDEFVWLAMEPVAGRDGRPRVLGVARDEGGLWLGNFFTSPDYAWDPSAQFVFRK